MFCRLTTIENWFMLSEANVAKCDVFTTLSVYDIGTTLVKSGVLNNKLAVANMLKSSVPSLAWEGVLCGRACMPYSLYYPAVAFREYERLTPKEVTMMLDKYHGRYYHALIRV